jgi:hypothetical protein
VSNRRETVDGLLAQDLRSFCHSHRESAYDDSELAFSLGSVVVPNVSPTRQQAKIDPNDVRTAVACLLRLM